MDRLKITRCLRPVSVFLVDILWMLSLAQLEGGRNDMRDRAIEGRRGGGGRPGGAVDVPATDAGGTVPRYRTLLVPLDGSARAEAVLPHATAVAGSLGSRILLLRVTTPPGAFVAFAAQSGMGTFPVHPAGIVDTGTVSDAERRESVAYLDAQAGALRRAGLEVSTDTESGAPTDAILNVAARENVDRIAMTTHGRGGLGRLILGSVAESVLRSAPCPVLIVRVEDQA
jgi:nucleotide-binding universal stress UspA family protein